MRYIRSPWWDGLFIFSGLPIGLALAFLYAMRRYDLLLAFLSVGIVLDTAHILSPLLLVGAHRSLREKALAEPVRFILVPVALIVGSAAGLKYVGSFGYLVVASWNGWHFCSQNFGVVQIYRRLWNWPGRRWLDRLMCFAMTGAFMFPPFTLALAILHIPYPQWWVPIARAPFDMPMIASYVFVVGMINFNHWLVALGLTTKVAQMPWWMWLGLLGLLGTSGFLWSVPKINSIAYAGVPSLIDFRMGLGLAHFWLDGLIWKRNSPAMKVVLA